MKSSEAIGRSIALLASAFRVELDELGAEAYYIGLEGLPVEQIRAATKAVLQSPNTKFMPTPGQLRELALTGGRGAENMASDAWQLFVKVVERIGGAKSVNFQDGLINATVRALGGWPHCAGLTGEAFDTWLRKDFTAAYGRLAGQQLSAEQIAYLPGSLERENGKWVGRPVGRNQRPYELPAPVPIGCQYQPPMLTSTPARQSLTRPAGVPRLELKGV